MWQDRIQSTRPQSANVSVNRSALSSDASSDRVVVGSRVGRMRPTTADGRRTASSSLLLKRRPSTPNTLHDIAGLFRHPPGGKPRAPFQVDRRRSIPMEDQNGQEMPLVFPQTVAFMSLLAAHQHPPSCGKEPSTVSEFASTHRLTRHNGNTRPASAPAVTSALKTAVGTPDAAIAASQRQPYLWRDLMLRPEQERFFAGRPLSAQNRRCLLPGNHSRPSSAQGQGRDCATHTPSVERHIGVEGMCDGFSGDFTAEVALVSKAQVALLARGESDVNMFDGVAETLELVCRLCAHLDAANHLVTVSRGAFPLPHHAPWSAISVRCCISKESFMFQLASSSSRVIGGRVFNMIMSVLNGVPSTSMDASGHYFAQRMSALTIRSASMRLNMTSDVPLHEVRRIEDEESEEPQQIHELAPVVVNSCAPSSPSSSPHESSATKAIQELEAVDFQDLRDEFSMDDSAMSPNNRSMASITRSTPTTSGSPCRNQSASTGALRSFRVRSVRSLRGVADGPKHPSARFSTDEDMQHHRGGADPSVATGTTMYVRDSRKMAAAAASLRRLSAESSPLAVIEHSGATRHPSMRRLRSSIRFASGFFSGAPTRKRVALVIAISTFEDTSIPCCPQICIDAAELVEHLEMECRFDRVVFLSSERPDCPDAVPSMRNIRKAADDIVATFLVEGVPDPSISVFVLSRGAVVSPGALPGVGPRSCRLVPFPSVAYRNAAVQAQQPAPGVKVALLETANTQALKSIDLMTPEMFFELFQMNGRLCTPTAVFFDVWPCSLAQGIVRPQCEDCGLCGLYSPLSAETDFTSISRKGVGGIGTHYLLKLLRGAVLRGAAKQPPNEGRTPVHHRVSRHIRHGLSLFHSDVHHYMVERLQRRNCGVLFASTLHINDAAESAATNLGHSSVRGIAASDGDDAASLQLGSARPNDASAKAYPPFQLHRHAECLQVPSRTAFDPIDSVSIQALLDRTAKEISAQDAVQSTFQMQITAPLALLKLADVGGGMPDANITSHSSAEAVDGPKLRGYSALVASTLAALLNTLRTDQRRSSPPVQVLSCALNPRMGPKVQFVAPGDADAVEVESKLMKCAGMLHDIFSAAETTCEIDVEANASAMTVTVRRASVGPSTPIPLSGLWDIAVLSNIGLPFEIRTISVAVCVRLRLNERNALKVSRAMRMGSLKPLGLVTSIEREGAAS